jgi:membrane dipeptidase
LIREYTVLLSRAVNLSFERLHLDCLPLQFWVAYVGCDSQFKDAVEQTMEQIDVIKRLVNEYPDDLHYATSAKGKY